MIAMLPKPELSHDELFATATKLYESNQGLALKLEQTEAQNQWLREQLKLARHKQFGPSSEATANGAAAGQGVLPSVLPVEGLLFNEAEATAQAEIGTTLLEPSLVAATEASAPASAKAKGKRARRIEHLSEEVIRYELPESEQVCRCCAHALHAMGEEVREELKFVPASASVIKHVQVKYACRHCAAHGTSTPIVIAPMPAPAFPGSLASPSAVAFIMSQKYELALPLYRLERYLNGLGIYLSRQTLSNWVLRGADLLKPLFLRMRQELLTREVLHADETPVQVLREPGRDATSKSYMWVYRSGRYDRADPEESKPEEWNPEKPFSRHLVLYDYQTTREAEHPRRFLAGFQGYLQVDGYAAYEKIPNVTIVGCWAHARRKFNEALQVAGLASKAARAGSKPHGAGTPAAPPSVAQTGMAYCNRLFQIESELREKTPEERLALRKAQSRPVLDEMEAWLKAQQPRVLPKSALGAAIGYCLNQWAKLTVFLLDGRVEIDNNCCERAVKPFVIGRKNWLFANVPDGARSSAIVYSLIETAKENGLRPAAYLEYVFSRLPTITTGDSTNLDDLMPWTHEVQTACK